VAHHLGAEPLGRLRETDVVEGRGLHATDGSGVESEVVERIAHAGGAPLFHRLGLGLRHRYAPKLPVRPGEPLLLKKDLVSVGNGAALPENLARGVPGAEEKLDVYLGILRGARARRQTIQPVALEELGIRAQEGTVHFHLYTTATHLYFLNLDTRPKATSPGPHLDTSF